jgi:hypothetical protein
MEATGSNPTAKETLLPSRDNADELYGNGFISPALPVPQTNLFP